MGNDIRKKKIGIGHYLNFFEILQLLVASLFGFILWITPLLNTWKERQIIFSSREVDDSILEPFPPTKPYFELWNYTTNRIDLQPHSGPLTSLEILERGIRETTIEDADDSTDPLPSCFAPNLTRSYEIVQKYSNNQDTSPPSSPLLNLGFPKVGTTTLQEFFLCNGYQASHSQNGNAMVNNVKKGRPPLSPARGLRGLNHFQMDFNFGNCTYPQITLLDEFHEAYPNATFFLNFRPVKDWIRSASQWNGLTRRWKGCKLPGLIHSANKSVSWSHDLQMWWCRHINHVREFVRQYPSHDLIELDLYDSESSSYILTSLFGGSSSCWGQSNVKASRIPQNTTKRPRQKRKRGPSNLR